MRPGTRNIHIYRGDTKVINLTISRSYMDEGVLVVEPIDVTGHVFTSQVRVDVNASEPAGEFTATIVDGPGGRVQLVMEPAVTSGFELPKMWWDVQSVDGDGFVQTWARGEVTVTFDVTRIEGA